MSSTSIYSHIPFFYIIEHIPSGKKYGGAKWSKDANPANFMIEGGYTTSSIKVNDLIKQDGLVSFRTILIVTEFGHDMTSFEYETIFLQTNDIANDDNWLNEHNNTGRPSFGSNEFKNIIQNRYGVENISQLQIVKQQKIDTSMKNYGVPYPSQHPTIQTRTEQTNLEKYGYKNPNQNEIVRNKTLKTLMETSNVTNPFQIESVKEKSKTTRLERYGVEYFSQSEDHKNKMSILLTGSTYWNDGKETYRVFVGDQPKSHWVLGVVPREISEEESKRRSEVQTGSTYWNDGKETYKVFSPNLPEPHWIRGHAPKDKSKYKSRVGTSRWNDGIQNYIVYEQDSPKPHWIRGFIKKIKVV
jgi:hypothetical protein